MVELTARERDVLSETGFSQEAIAALQARAKPAVLVSALRFQAILGPLFVPVASLLLFFMAIWLSTFVPGVNPEELDSPLFYWSALGLVMFNLFFQVLRFVYWVVDMKGSGWREVVQASRAASYGFVDHREYPKAQLAGFARAVQSEGSLDEGLRAEMGRIVRSRAILLGFCFTCHLAVLMAFVAVIVLR